MPGGPGMQRGVALPHGTGWVRRRARDLPPAPARAPGCAGAAGTRRPRAQDDLKRMFWKMQLHFLSGGWPRFHSTGSGTVLKPCMLVSATDPKHDIQTLCFSALRLTGF